MNNCYHSVFITQSGKVLVGNSFPFEDLALTNIKNISTALDKIQEGLKDILPNLPIVNINSLFSSKVITCESIPNITDDELKIAIRLHMYTIVNPIIHTKVLTEDELLHNENVIYLSDI